MTINELVKKAHENAACHGFWDDPLDFGTSIALIHSELSEALEEHRNGKGAIYTRSRGAVRIEAAWSCKEKGDALRLESAIKKLPKGKKEKLAAGTEENLPASVSELIETFFHRVENICHITSGR